MSDSAATTFFSILVLVMVAIAWWRTAMMIFGGLLISLLIYGIYGILNEVERQSSHGVEVAQQRLIEAG